MKLESQRDAAKHNAAMDTTTILRATDVISVSLATARKPTIATDATCKTTSSALMAFSAALQLVHCTTCDQYLSVHGIGDWHQEMSIKETQLGCTDGACCLR